jgi:hypothetical protein
MPVLHIPAHLARCGLAASPPLVQRCILSCHLLNKAAGRPVRCEEVWLLSPHKGLCSFQSISKMPFKKLGGKKSTPKSFYRKQIEEDLFLKINQKSFLS